MSIVKHIFDKYNRNLRSKEKLKLLSKALNSVDGEGWEGKKLDIGDEEFFEPSQGILPLRWMQQTECKNEEDENVKKDEKRLKWR